MSKETTPAERVTEFIRQWRRRRLFEEIQRVHSDEHTKTAYLFLEDLEHLLNKATANDR